MKRTRKRKGLTISLLVGSTLLIGGCVTERARAALSMGPRELNVDASRYDGTDVAITGWLQLDKGAGSLWASKQAMREGLPLAECVTVSLPDSMGDVALEGRRVLAKGKFIADGSSYILLAGCANRSLLFISSLEAAE